MNTRKVAAPSWERELKSFTFTVSEPGSLSRRRGQSKSMDRLTIQRLTGQNPRRKFGEDFGEGGKGGEPGHRGQLKAQHGLQIGGRVQEDLRIPSTRLVR